MTQGERIRQRRKELRMTQDELAKKIGATYQLISNYENGVVVDIPATKTALMAKALDCDPIWLAYGVYKEQGMTVDQLMLIELIKSASPDKVAEIYRFAQFVLQS